MDDPRQFYRDIPPFNDIRQIVEVQHYRPVPPDWWVALTDVRGSTKAIEQGRYKEVNGLAAASITALLNCSQGVELPFVFGGDGATILIPPDLVDAARQALQATQVLAQTQFDLELRAGLVPMTEVLARGAQVQVAKLRYSDNFQQAIFRGGGLSVAEALLKDPIQGQRYAVLPNPQAEADFSGFECRWSAIPSRSEEAVCLLVVAQGPPEQHTAIYRQVLALLESIYGDMQARNPLVPHNMHVARHPRLYAVETAIRQRSRSLAHRLTLMIYSLLGYLLWRYKDKIWDRYRQVVIEATDREKFDDALRMIISGTAQQRQALREGLEALRQQGKLVYGTYVTTHALMTCLVFERFGRQVHFLDGSGGGYALAAREMKAQLKALKAD
ncbi:MAG: DUF3095 domain-containing protein [Anaerolineae bacterium]|nr:DUF3095 domain-containing protein [Anaerolineae bacterium]MDW8172863.1 DUF3095 domain-containing protein [Anaerolineae bacterium]